MSIRILKMKSLSNIVNPNFICIFKKGVRDNNKNISHLSAKDFARMISCKFPFFLLKEGSDDITATLRKNLRESRYIFAANFPRHLLDRFCFNDSFDNIITEIDAHIEHSILFHQEAFLAINSGSIDVANRREKINYFLSENSFRGGKILAADIQIVGRAFV